MPANNLKAVQKRLDALTDEMIDTVELHLKDNGLTSEESQKVYLMNSIYSTQAIVNGINPSDLK